ncbi:MAG TPA: S1 family peptidase [Candidatus Limnocylindrales bacterium]
MTRHRWLVGLLAAGTTVMILTGPAAVAIAGTTLAWTPEAGSKLEAEQPDLFAALQRDLHLDRDEAIVRVGRSQSAHRIHDKLRATLGRAYGGAWLDPDGSVLTVAVADKRLTGVVAAAGARPRLVAHPLADLQAAVDRMSPDGLPAGIQTWHVDQAANKIVVKTSKAGRAAGAAMVARSGVDPDLVRYVTVEGTMTATTTNVYAGDTESLSGCTVGFGVRRRDIPTMSGFLTAGHCGATGRPVRFSTQDIGRVVTSTFDNTGPGPDRGWAEITNENFRATGEMNTFVNGMLRQVSGPVVLVTNDFVCQAGRVSKFRCGSVQDTDVPMLISFNINGRIVQRLITGLTITSICGANGDSGAPVVGDGFRAAGVQVAATGDILFGASCERNPNGPTAYQPIQPILDDFFLELIPPTGTRPIALHIDSSICGAEPIGRGWVCYVRWAGGVDLATATWTVPVPRPLPYVITDPVARVTEAHFACFFDEAEPDYLAQLNIRDAVGARVSFFHFVCPW